MRTSQIVRPACDSATRQARPPALRTLDYGDIDGGCKAVIGQRRKLSGMHWTA
jgi:hypothetical protein